ncbi:MAG: translesion error-prone DNA polymerase V autoproteolytic subunit [Candidatus Methylopumilus sp.]|nr:translesion error-prone DNA polymerase V autoproteolytic subunit [Candidatus Methylopumilus sp.]
MKKIVPIRGGKRVGAGRKSGTGKFGEKTTLIRIPESQTAVISNILEAYAKRKIQEISNVVSIDLVNKALTKTKIPLFEHKVPAGLPSAVDDHVEKRMDLNDYLIREADTTFFVRIKGASMDNAGIHDDDVVIVDRSQEASIGDIVLASLDGEFTVKTLAKNKNGSPRLLPANEAFSPIEVLEGVQFEIWGVVTGAVRKFK